MIKIITLVENITYQQGIKGEHGLSFLIKTDDLTLLFDTGQTDQFIQNAEAFGEDLSKVDYLIISHGHYDHAGGILAFLNYNKTAKVLIKQEAFNDKFSKASGSVRPVGIPHNLHNHFHRFQYVTNFINISSSICILSEIKSQTSYETPNTRLLINSDSGMIPDPFNDELVLYLIHNNELVVISGCAHRGIINTLFAIQQHSGLTDFRFIIGGTHLNGAPTHRLKATAEAMNEMQIKALMPNHCTGISAYQYLVDNVQSKISYASTGTVVTL